MSTLNSYAEFVKGTYGALIVDCALQYPELTKELNRDLQRICSAIDKHGVRFTLDVMPSFRKHFDTCLSKGRLTATGFLHFGVDKKQGTIPRLFRGLVLRVFDRNGALKLQPDSDAVRWIRQLLGIVRKLRLASSVKDQGNAVRDFLKLDLEVKDGTLNWADPSLFDSEDAARLSFTDYRQDHLIEQESLPGLETTNSDLPYGLLVKVQQVADLITSQLGVFSPLDWRFRHGPGAVADQKWGNTKYRFRNWPLKLESVFPYADFAHANYAQVEVESVSKATSRGFYQERPAKLHAVPKTLTTPRLIASEPVSHQWCQQAIKSYFADRSKHSFIRGFVDFRRQDLNGRLALRASHCKSHATIDLSSASDLVSCWHVERLFRRSPSLLSALQASRSVWLEQKIDGLLPRFSRIRKYSTMGNATTFPVQSLFFLSLALGTLTYVRGLKVCFKTMEKLGKWQVRVFGDDIIVPDDCSGQLVELIQAFGLKVNPKKTFTEGHFRESCGVDAFAGNDVTSVSILDVPRRASPGSIVSCVDVHHNLCEAGLVNTAAYVRKIAGREVHNQIPFVKHGSGFFGWSDLLGTVPTNTSVRWNRTLQIREVKGLTLKVKTQRLHAEDSSGLLQFFTEAANVVTSAVSTLGHLAQRPKAKLGRGWVFVG